MLILLGLPLLLLLLLLLASLHLLCYCYCCYCLGYVVVAGVLVLTLLLSSALLLSFALYFFYSGWICCKVPIRQNFATVFWHFGCGMTAQQIQMQQHTYTATLHTPYTHKHIDSQGLITYIPLTLCVICNASVGVTLELFEAVCVCRRECVCMCVCIFVWRVCVCACVCVQAAQQCGMQIHWKRQAAVQGYFYVTQALTHTHTHIERGYSYALTFATGADSWTSSLRLRFRFCASSPSSPSSFAASFLAYAIVQTHRAAQHSLN